MQVLNRKFSGRSIQGNATPNDLGITEVGLKIGVRSEVRLNLETNLPTAAVTADSSQKTDANIISYCRKHARLTEGNDPSFVGIWFFR